MTSAALAFEARFALREEAGRPVLRGSLHVRAPMVFLPFLRMHLACGSSTVESCSADTFYVGWLPRGAYRIDFVLPQPLPAGRATFRVEAGHRVALTQDVIACWQDGEALLPGSAAASTPGAWSIEGIAPTPPLAALSWKKGHADWFFRHFDHAAPVVTTYLLGDSPLLRGRILDVGCGDGITDLGIALRTGCEELVGVDPFRGFERLPQVLAENHLPPDVVPPTLRFLAADANALPFDGDRFDVVVSWGSLEHIAGGHQQALREVRRVLKPGGLFFANPGLYYSNVGHHLGEFCDEQFFHLRKSEEELRRMVMQTPPRYIDRAGEFASNAQYWQWYKELNRITVTSFEKEMRELGFRPWRAAIRTQDLIEYTPEIEHYPMQDLATGELYSSWFNRK